MNWLDSMTERLSRGLAKGTSRRSWLTRMGGLLVGAQVLPLLPIARASAEGGKRQADDDTQCDYWRYCGIDGFLCSCCGGTVSICPPGTEMSPISWIGTCHNPADGMNYIISYNDCCGKSSCGRCLCSGHERDTPTYRPQTNGDTNWCLGTKSSVYHCSAAIVLGVAEDK